MSRCFPFPPPGYRAHGDALIESIKLREEMEKAEKERKEKKREKKEKKREKKEKKQRRKEEKERKLKEGTKTSHGTEDGKKFKLIKEIKETKADGKLQKGEDCENEQLERSGITEELDQPVTSVEPCCLSDSTQSSKRKRSSPQTSHDNGPAIKIRLPLRKHREPEESKSKSKFQAGSSGTVGGNAESFNKITFGCDTQAQGVGKTDPKQILASSDSRHCKVLQNSVRGDAKVTKSTLGSDPKSTDPKRALGNSGSRNGKTIQDSVRGDAVITKGTLGSGSQLQRTKNTESKRVLGNSDSRHCKAQHNLVRGDAMVIDNVVDVAMEINKVVDDGIQNVESLYKSLLQIPALKYDGLDSLDQDWLFSSEPTEAMPVSKKQKSDSDVFQLSTSMWPRAQYLPEVEVYALPYAVPF